MKFDFHCLSFNNPQRRLRMESRFRALDLEVRLSEGVPFSDDRIQGRSLDDHTKRVWSCMYGHLDMIERFYRQSDADLGVFCEDDVLIHKDLKRRLPKIGEVFFGLHLDVLLLGYLAAFKIEDGTHPFFSRLTIPAHLGSEFSLFTYPDDLWGAQMYVLSRDQAQRLLSTFAEQYADTTIADSHATPFSADWTITKRGTRALIAPMLAVEDGLQTYVDPGQRQLHAATHDVHYDAKTFVQVDETLKGLASASPAIRSSDEQSMPDTRDAKLLLGLVMIVKDEAHGIAKTLESFKSVIGTWTILDTGSTDGTQDVIRQVLADVPGHLHEEPFVDFATSRNRALELHGEASIFTVMPDSDDRLDNALVLGGFLASRVESHDSAYCLNIRRGELDYWLPLVLRAKARWRYRGRVHECCVPQAGEGYATVQIKGVALRQDRPPQSHEATKRRWERDLRLLREDLITDPKNARTMFYLAQTHECLGQPEQALALYELHLKTHGWIEEHIEAAIRRAKILKVLGKPWSEVQQAFLDAYRMDTRRAEPLFYIAEHWYAEQVHPLVVLFAGRAARLAPVATALFLDRDIYDYRAANLAAISGFYCDQLGDPDIKREGKRCAEKTVRARPGNELFRSNWAFYAPSVMEAFGARIQSVAFAPDEPYTASNPSVYYDGQRWRVLVRTTNYKIINGQYLTPNDNVIYTRNWMVELDGDLAVQSAVEMKDLTELPKTNYPVHGYEDCRLFRWKGTLYASSTVCDWTASGERELTIIRLDDAYQIVEAWPMRGSWSVRPQKNWMPILDEDAEEMRFIYATKDPTTILSVDLSARQIVPPKTLDHGRLRGGSQVVKVGDSWLFVVHDVSWPGGNARTYLHRFVEMDGSFQVIAMSDPFYFERRGIEFCAGLGYDGEKLVASFSVEDRCAKLAIFDVDKVRSMLRRDYTV